jgi:hypothetical protein
LDMMRRNQHVRRDFAHFKRLNANVDWLVVTDRIARPSDRL